MTTTKTRALKALRKLKNKLSECSQKAWGLMEEQEADFDMIADLAKRAMTENVNLSNYYYYTDDANSIKCYSLSIEQRKAKLFAIEIKIGKLRERIEKIERKYLAGSN